MKGLTRKDLADCSKDLTDHNGLLWPTCTCTSSFESHLHVMYMHMRIQCMYTSNTCTFEG